MSASGGIIQLEAACKWSGRAEELSSCCRVRWQAHAHQHVSIPAISPLWPLWLRLQCSKLTHFCGCCNQLSMALHMLHVANSNALVRLGWRLRFHSKACQDGKFMCGCAIGGAFGLRCWEYIVALIEEGHLAARWLSVRSTTLESNSFWQSLIP